jgi:hypothetical protein
MNPYATMESIPLAPFYKWVHISIIAFSIVLLAIGSGIRVFLIFIVIGLSLIALWLYLDIRKEKQKKGVYVNTIQAYICPICKHKETKICLQQKCACCLIMK